MKTTDPRDPLDRKLDALLASRPLKADRDFSARVLAAVETEAPPTSAAPAASAPQTHAPRPLLRFALPLAAALALAGTLIQFTAPPPHNLSQPALSAAEIQEIFLLEEGLNSLNQLQDASLGSDDPLATLGSDDLLATLDALYFDLES